MLGVFDLTYIKGRAGWYYLFIFAIAISFLISYIKVISARYELIPSFFVLVAIVVYFYWPIYHYRHVDENVYRLVRDLTLEVENSNKIFINNTLPYAKNISNKIYISSVEAFMSDPSKVKTTIIVLDFNSRLIDPTLSRQFQKSEINNPNFLDNLYQIRDDKIRGSALVQKYLLDEDYKLYKSVDGYKIFWKSNTS
jgi:c-di-AMP phosphodiesterase-like protein